MALTSKVESYVTYNEHEGLDVRKLEGYVTYQKQFEWKKIYIEPNMSSNGTWMATDDYSCKGSGLENLDSLYQVFNGTYTSYLNKFNEDTYIEICLPTAVEVAGCDISSSDGYLPKTGDVYYSDDGNTYTKCGSWTDTSGSKNTTVYTSDGSGAHRIWKFVSTSRASAHPSSAADISTAKLFTKTKEYLSVDNTLPKGIGGVVNAYATYKEHSGLDVRKLEVYVTYKEHDNSFDGNIILNGLQVQETPDSGYYLPLNLTVLENNQPVIKNLAIVPTDIDTEKNIAHITLDDGTKLTYPLHKKS